MENCIFCKIIKKEIPGKIVYEDNELVAFYDINPKAEVHILVTPVLHIESMKQLEEKHINLMGRAMLLLDKLAKEHGLVGYQVHVNTGKEGGQEVFHLHLHLLGNKSKF